MYKDLPKGYWEYQKKLNSYLMNFIGMTIFIMLAGTVAAVISLNVDIQNKVLFKVLASGSIVICFGFLAYNVLKYRLAKCIRCDELIYWYKPTATKCEKCGLVLNLRKEEVESADG